MSTRAPDISVNLNLKAIIGALVLLAPLVAVINSQLQIRQDVRDNTRRQIAQQQRQDEFDRRLKEVERAKLTYCIGRASDGQVKASTPDAGC